MNGSNDDPADRKTHADKNKERMDEVANITQGILRLNLFVSLHVRASTSLCLIKLNYLYHYVCVPKHNASLLKGHRARQAVPMQLDLLPPPGHQHRRGKLTCQAILAQIQPLKVRTLPNPRGHGPCEAVLRQIERRERGAGEAEGGGDEPFHTEAVQGQHCQSREGRGMRGGSGCLLLLPSDERGEPRARAVVAQVERFKGRGGAGGGGEGPEVVVA